MNRRYGYKDLRGEIVKFVLRCFKKNVYKECTGDCEGFQRAAATAHRDPGRREGLWGPGRFLLLATQVEASPPRPRDPPPASQEIK